MPRNISAIFQKASRTAKAIVEAAREEEKAEADGPVLTVRSAVEVYIAGRNVRHSNRVGRAVRSDADHRLSHYVLGQRARGKQAAIPAAPLASVRLHELKENDLLTWRKKLPGELKESTKRRLVSDLRASLNSIYPANRKRLDASFAGVVKDALKTIQADDDDTLPIARENQVLTDDQVAEVIRAAHKVDAEQQWEGDLFRLVVTLAATGARFSQVARMRVSNAQLARKRLLVPVSRKGSGQKNGTIAIPVGDDVFEALLPATTDRRNDALLLERWRYKQIAGSIKWHREKRGAWRTASEMVRPWSEIRRRAGMPELIPYALRHTSIVRGIRANLPIRLVAALHDTSVEMIERHYAKWIVDGLDELAARAVVPLIPSNKPAKARELAD